MTKIKLMNMCMIYDEATHAVVVQDKINMKHWKGFTFPGGHVENGESLIESTIREVKEETGLIVDGLKHVGLINWYNTNTHERWFVFLYKSTVFSGELIDETHEGKVFWMNYDDFRQAELASDMNHYLKLFENDDLEEAYAEWHDDFATEFKFL